MLGYAYVQRYYLTQDYFEDKPDFEYLTFLTENLEGDVHALQAFLGEYTHQILPAEQVGLIFLLSLSRECPDVSGGSQPGSLHQELA